MKYIKYFVGLSVSLLFSGCIIKTSEAIKFNKNELNSVSIPSKQKMKEHLNAKGNCSFKLDGVVLNKIKFEKGKKLYAKAKDKMFFNYSEFNKKSAVTTRTSGNDIPEIQDKPFQILMTKGVMIDGITLYQCYVGYDTKNDLQKSIAYLSNLGVKIDEILNK